MVAIKAKNEVIKGLKNDQITPKYRKKLIPDGNFRRVQSKPL